MLYLVPTPIGNLSDISFRAIETLKQSDYVLCEDTRRSRILFERYAINTPLKSFHKFSEKAKEEAILNDLRQGCTVSLISDAGTPGISDPGERLVKSCRKEAIPVTPIPGPCALTVALSASGLSTTPFQFVGFLPRKTQELKRQLIELLLYPGTSICYESCNRIGDVLRIINEMAPARTVVIAKELTKKFEEFLYGSAQDVLQLLLSKPLKGEITFLIEGDPEAGHQKWALLAPQEHVKSLMDSYGLSQKEAIKLAAELRGVPKRVLKKQEWDASQEP